MRAGSKGSTFRTLISKRRWSEAEGRRVVEAWQASGLSVAAFARKVGLPAWRVRSWRRRLGNPEPAPRFLPVRLVGQDRERGHEGNVALEINTRGGLRLVVPIAAEAVCGLVLALEGGSC